MNKPLPNGKIDVFVFKRGWGRAVNGRVDGHDLVVSGRSDSVGSFIWFLEHADSPAFAPAKHRRMTKLLVVREGLVVVHPHATTRIIWIVVLCEGSSPQARGKQCRSRQNGQL